LNAKSFLKKRTALKVQIFFFFLFSCFKKNLFIKAKYCFFARGTTPKMEKTDKPRFYSFLRMLIFKADFIAPSRFF